MLEKDRNPIRIFAVTILVLLCCISFYLAIYESWSIATAFNFIGIISNLIGTLWIASGVYLLNSDKDHLTKVSPSKAKYSKRLAELLSAASRTIPLGVLYILLGSSYQLFVVIGTELKWF